MNRERPLDVLVVGDLFLDLVMSGFESWPRPGEESIAKKFHKEVGGGAAITACGLSKLGLQTGILGIVGKEDGQWMLNQLRARGVDTSRIQVTSAEPTAFSISVSTALDRTFLTYTGANRGLLTLLDDLIGIASDCQVRHIHLAHAMDLANLQASFKAVKDNGWSLSVDVGWHPEWYGDARAVAALKLGKNGAALLWDGNICLQKPRTIASVDTTGAGDCFDAGFLYAWLGGMDPALCLKAGAACGEMSTRAMGGIAGFPSKEELETIL